MSLNRFFLFFLASSLGIYFFLTPYVIDQQKLKDIPLLEFDSFITYDIGQGSLKVMLMGDKARRYPARMTLEDFSFYREDESRIQTISAQKGLFKGDDIFFEGLVEYQEADALSLSTDKATYNMKYETLDIRAPFTLLRDGSIIKGSSLFFNQKNDKIEAKDVQASLPTN